MPKRGSIRVAVLAVASLMSSAALASAQCPASPNYSPDFSANQSCLSLNGNLNGATSSAFPTFGPPLTPQQPVSNVLRLTPAAGGWASSAWYSTAQNVTAAFSTTFAFQLGGSTSAIPADGIAFVIQNSGTTALGPQGCGIGFGGSNSCGSPTSGIPSSVAIEFNTYNNGSPVDPNSANDVAIQSCGASPNLVDYASNCNLAFNTLTGGINLTDGAVHIVTVKYTPSTSTNCGVSGTQSCSTLDVVLDGTDLFPGGVLFDMTSITGGGTTAFVGFTGSTGGSNEEQDITNWIFAPTVTQTAPVTGNTPTTFNVNGGFNPTTPAGYNFSAQQTTTNQNLQMVVTTIPLTQQACNTLVHKNSAFQTAQCFVYQNGGGPGQDTAVLFEVTCPANPKAACGSAGNNFFADLGTQFSFNCSENPNLACPALSTSTSGGSFGLPHLTSSDNLPSIGFLKGEGPDSNHPCTPFADGVTALFASNQIESFKLGDTSGGAKGGSGGTTSCWVMTYLTQSETPTVTVTTPAPGATYAQNSSQAANYFCTAVSTGDPNTVAAGPYLTIPAPPSPFAGVCSATDSPGGAVADGAPFDTATLGPHTFTAQVQDSAMNTNLTSVNYTVVAPPTISGPSSANFNVGSLSAVVFRATGYPVPTFTETGALPAGVTFVDNKDGTATLAGTPTVSGIFPITITASNTYGAQTLVFTLNAAANAPTASNKCNGVYDGTFKGNLTVSAGQTCIFVGGGVTGNVVENGGKLILTNAAVGGSLQVNGGTFSIGPATSIKGNLNVLELGKSAVQNTICGATIGASLQVLESAAPVAIGNGTAACLGNIISGNLNVAANNAAIAMYGNSVGGSLLDLANAKPTQVFSNQIKVTLTCAGDSGISGGGNTAPIKLGQCSKF